MNLKPISQVVVQESQSDMVLLAQYMASFNPMQGHKFLLGQVDRFLKKSYKSGPLVIFTLPVEESQLSGNFSWETTRLFWNKRSVGHDYPEDLFQDCVKKLISQDSDEGYLYNALEGERSFFIFPCGANEGPGAQKYYGFVELSRPLDRNVLHLFSKFMTTVMNSWFRLDELKKVENLIHVDDVTGLYNQRKLLKDLDAAIDRYKEVGEEFSVLFIDIDHFKSVNDGHGHLIGTKLLKSMGVLLKKVLRESDLIYRYGGDEFVIVIPDIGPDVAKTIGERVLVAVKEEAFNVEDKIPNELKNFNLSVSIGVSSFPTDANGREEILRIADRMMYEAKKSGRGKVCFTSEILNPEEKVSES